MILILAVSSLFCFILAWFLNLLLLSCLFQHNSIQNSGYRLISLSIVIFDLLFSAAYAITVPLFHADGNLVLLIPVGYTSTISISSFLGSLVRPSYIIWHACMITTSFLVAITFAYRYTVICNSKRLQKLYNSRVARAILFTFCATFALTQGFLLDWATSPLDNLSDTMNRLLSDVYGVDFSQVYYQGNDMNDPTMKSRGLVGMGLSGLFQVSFVVIIFVVFYTGSKIYSVIRHSIVSRRAQEKQQQVFRMLVCQALSPFFFLYLPPFIDATSITIGYKLPFFVCIVKAILVYLFPIANPLAILLFTDDYRYFIRNGKQRIKSDNSINTVANFKSIHKRTSLKE